MGPGQKAASALLSALCMAALGGCGDGLGECNEMMLGGNEATGAPFDGQQIVATRCASSRCHSEGAVGAARFGAPGELNFDVVGTDHGKLYRNAATVLDWREDMWDEIDSGSMPPEPPAGSGELSGADKETVRNWLACGAPVILGSTDGAATWDSIWTSLSPTCLGCHSSAAGASAGMGFVLGDDACSSYDNIFMAPSVTPMCSMTSMTIVDPSSPDTSLLYQKLTDTQTCGDPMPPFGALVEMDAALVARIEQWIMSGAPKPASCP